MALSNKFVAYLAMMYKHRKQDSLIFKSHTINKNILEHLQTIRQDIFSSDCPIILPIEYSYTVSLRLDNNIVFYEEHDDGTYSLVDKHTVNEGTAFTLEIGSWYENTGVHLKEKKNRWDRRTDLMGSTFINTLYENHVGSSAYFIYDSSNGTLIGSGGIYQDQLFYITDRLNLTVKTRDESEIEGAGGDCFNALLDLQYTDICSGG